MLTLEALCVAVPCSTKASAPTAKPARVEKERIEEENDSWPVVLVVLMALLLGVALGRKIRK